MRFAAGASSRSRRRAEAQVIGGFMGAKEEIANSFRDLIVNKGVPYEKVAVYQICDHAKVSRKTFYVHYRSKADIVDQIVSDRIISPLAKMNDAALTLMQNDTMIQTFPEAINEVVYKAIRDDGEFYSRLCCKAGSLDSPFVESLIKAIQSLNLSVLELIGFPGPDWMKGYISYFHAAGNAVLVQRWIRRGMKESPEELAKLFNAMDTPHWLSLANLKGSH